MRNALGHAPRPSRSPAGPLGHVAGGVVYPRDGVAAAVAAVRRGRRLEQDAEGRLRQLRRPAGALAARGALPVPR